ENYPRHSPHESSRQVMRYEGQENVVGCPESLFAPGLLRRPRRVLARRIHVSLGLAILRDRLLPQLRIARATRFHEPLSRGFAGRESAVVARGDRIVLRAQLRRRDSLQLRLLEQQRRLDEKIKYE